MPEHDDKLCGDSAGQITFDAKPDDLALLLELIVQRQISSSPTWNNLERVMTLGERYQFFHVPSLVLIQTTVSTPKGDSWNMFQTASKLRLVKLGKEAIRGFQQSSDSRFWNTTRLTRNMMQDVPGDWVIALIRAMEASPMGSMTDWDAAARAFRIADW